MITREQMKEMQERAGQPTYDGVIRSPDAEEKINQTVRAVLSGPNGRALMDYLRSITVNFVVPPSATDAELRHHEGKRHLFQILDARLKSQPKD